MSAALNKNLLDSEREASPRSYRRTVVVSAAVAALLLSASFVGYAVGKNSANVNKQVFGNHTELGVIAPPDLGSGLPKYQFDHECYSYDGNTCSSNSNCLQPGTQCKDGKCLCAHGCVGADGACGNPYKKVNKAVFKITNKHWPSYDMMLPYLAPLSQMRTAKWVPTTAGFYFNFNLYKLPGKFQIGRSRHSLYFLTLEEYPDWTVSIHATGGILGSGSISKWGLYAMDMATEKDPGEIAVRICNMKRLANLPHDAVKIGRILRDGRTVWARVHAYSNFVYGWDTVENSQGPSDKGYWTFNETAMYDEFEDCDS